MLNFPERYSPYDVDYMPCAECGRAVGYYDEHYRKDGELLCYECGSRYFTDDTIKYYDKGEDEEIEYI